MPLVTLLLHIFNGLIYDLDSPAEWKNRYFVVIEAVIWNIIIQGILQPLIACLIAFLLCPIITVFIFFGYYNLYYIIFNNYIILIILNVFLYF